MTSWAPGCQDASTCLTPGPGGGFGAGYGVCESEMEEELSVGLDGWVCLGKVVCTL